MAFKSFFCRKQLGVNDFALAVDEKKRRPQPAGHRFWLPANLYQVQQKEIGSWLINWRVAASFILRNAYDAAGCCAEFSRQANSDKG